MLKFPKTDSRDWHKKKWTGVGRNPPRLVTVAHGGTESQRFGTQNPSSKVAAVRLELHCQQECCKMSELQNRKNVVTFGVKYVTLKWKIRRQM